MTKPYRVCKDVYAIGGPELTHPYDCCVYLVGELVLIDSGAGESFDLLVNNIESLGFKPEKLRAVIATHAHIDHIGALYRFREEFGVQVIAHELEVKAIETGRGTGAEFYGVPCEPCQVDIKLSSLEEVLPYGDGGYELKVIHIPGHTPGSVAVYVDMEKRILFGQDVHGPYFLPGSDPGQAKASLQKLIDLEADILCEGHFGIYQPADEVKRYIEGYLYSLYS